MERLALLLALIVAQGALGYTQYFNGVPPLLVGFHVAGATAVFSATLAVLLGDVRAGPRAGPVAAEDDAAPPAPVAAAGPPGAGAAPGGRGRRPVPGQ